MPYQHAPEGGLHCSTNLRGAEVFLAGSRPAGLCSLWPKSTSSPQDASGLSSCQEQGTWDMRHCPPPHHTEEPLGRATVSVLRAAEHPKGQQETLAIKEWVSAPRETRGKECNSACESALGFPWHGVRATAVLLPSFPWSWPVLGMALASLPALTGDKMLSSKQGRSCSSSSLRCPQGFCPQLLQSLEEAI